MVMSFMEKNEAGNEKGKERKVLGGCKNGDRASFTVKMLFQTDPEGASGGSRAGNWQQCREGGRRVVQDGGIHVHPWLIRIDVMKDPSQYCKVIILQLK